jgi:hypothetical protein
MSCYPKEIFSPQISKDFVCHICNQVVRNPMIDLSGNTIGKDCFQQIIANGNKCSPNGHILTNRDIIQNKAVESIMKHFRVKCRNYNLCEWTGDLENLDGHLNSDCLFEDVQCHINICKYTCQRRFILFHENKCDKGRENCTECEANSLKKEYISPKIQQPYIKQNTYSEWERHRIKEDPVCQNRPYLSGGTSKDLKMTATQIELQKEIFFQMNWEQYKLKQQSKDLNRGSNINTNEGLELANIANSYGTKRSKHDFKVKDESQFFLNDDELTRKHIHKLTDKVMNQIEMIYDESSSENKSIIIDEMTQSREGNIAKPYIRDHKVQKQLRSEVKLSSNIKEHDQKDQNYEDLNHPRVIVKESVLQAPVDIFRNLTPRQLKLEFNSYIKSPFIDIISPNKIICSSTGPLILLNINFVDNQIFTFKITKQLSQDFGIGACIKSTVQANSFFINESFSGFHGCYLNCADGFRFSVQNNDGFPKTKKEYMKLKTNDVIEMNCLYDKKILKIKNLNSKNSIEISLENVKDFDDLYPCVVLEEKEEAIQLVSPKKMLSTSVEFDVSSIERKNLKLENNVIERIVDTAQLSFLKEKMIANFEYKFKITNKVSKCMAIGFANMQKFINMNYEVFLFEENHGYYLFYGDGDHSEEGKKGWSTPVFHNTSPFYNNDVLSLFFDSSSNTINLKNETQKTSAKIHIRQSNFDIDDFYACCLLNSKDESIELI